MVRVGDVVEWWNVVWEGEQRRGKRGFGKCFEVGRVLPECVECGVDCDDGEPLTVLVFDAECLEREVRVCQAEGWPFAGVVR